MLFDQPNGWPRENQDGTTSQLMNDESRIRDRVWSIEEIVGLLD